MGNENGDRELERRPLEGLRVIELAGIGPAQLGAMVFADLGAEVIRVDRVQDAPPAYPDSSSSELMGRGRLSIALDLKHSQGVAWARELVDGADILIDPYRPGVASRLGLDPEECLERNPRLIVAQMTGWGQDGPLAAAAGHDLNYSALAGAIHPMGDPTDPPPVPLNLIADFGGGGMYLAAMVLAALARRERDGAGGILDVAMVDGVATLMTGILQLRAEGLWVDRRGENVLDGGSPFYRSYRTADDRYLTVGAIEPQFYRVLLDLLDLEQEDWPQWDRERWPALTAELESLFAKRSLAEWRGLLEATDACFAPALTFAELEEHPHLVARSTFVQHAGNLQPSPARAFGAGAKVADPAWPGEHTVQVLEQLGISEPEIEAAFAAGFVSEPGRSPGPGPRNLFPS
jgi:alpha-methylacyl-CoA racemase